MDTNWELLRPVLVTSIQETLVMVTVTVLVAGIAGLVLGAALYATRPGNLLEQPVVFAVLNLVVNIVRPVPFIIFIGRVVEQNLVGVDPGVVEAARAAGAGRLRTLFGIVIPEALGPLILGYTFMFIAIVDMSAMVGVVGGGGLGNFAIMYGYQQFDWTVTLVTVVVIIVFVQLAQLVGNTLAARVLRR
jgi:D-methionine transport system permease protein